MWTLSIEDDQAERNVVELERAEYTIGRAKDNDLQLAERNVSRKHAKILREGEDWILEDLSSENGTKLNGENVEGSIALDHGDRLYVGDYVLSLSDERRAKKPGRVPSEEDTVRYGTESLSLNHNRLAVVHGPGRGTQHELANRRMLIGRGEECDITLTDTSVSRVHARIEPLQDGRYLLTDEDSSNGIRINGRKVPSMLLDTGDMVELGDVVLQFLPSGESFDLSASADAELTHSQAATPSNRRVLGAVLGAVAMACGFFYLMKTNSGRSDLGPQLLLDAEAHLERGDIETAAEYLRRIPAASELTTSESYRRIATTWADARLIESQKSLGEELQRGILSSIASAHFVDSTRRENAKSLLAALDRAKVVPPGESTTVDSLEPFDGGGATNTAPSLNSPRAGASRNPTPKPTATTKQARRTASPRSVNNNNAPSTQIPNRLVSKPTALSPLKRDPWQAPAAASTPVAPTAKSFPDGVVLKKRVSPLPPNALLKPAPPRPVAPYPPVAVPKSSGSAPAKPTPAKPAPMNSSASRPSTSP